MRGRRSGSLVLAVALTLLGVIGAQASAAPVPVLEEVVSTEDIPLENIEAVAVSPEGYVALTDGWSVLVRTPEGEFVEAPFLDISPDAIKWSGRRLLVAGMVSAIIDPFTGEVVARRYVGLIPMYALFAGDYGVVGDTEGFVVVGYGNDSVAVVANVTVEEVIAGLGKSGEADMYVVGATYAEGWVAVIGFTDVTPSWFLALIGPSTGEAMFYDLAEMGVTDVIEYTAFAGVAQVGEYLIIYGFSDEVALLRVGGDGVSFLGRYRVTSPGNITAVIGWGHWIGGETALLVGAYDIDNSAVDLYHAAFIVEVGEEGLRVVGAATIMGKVSPYTTGPGPFFVRTESGEGYHDTIYFYRVVLPPEHPPSPFIYVTSSGLTVTVNAELSYDPGGDITSMIVDYGDGAVEEYGELVAEHTYQAEGCYNINVTLRDAAGNSNTAELTACVEDTPAATQATATTTTAEAPHTTTTTPAPVGEGTETAVEEGGEATTASPTGEAPSGAFPYYLLILVAVAAAVAIAFAVMRGR